METLFVFVKVVAIMTWKKTLKEVFLSNGYSPPGYNIREHFYEFFVTPVKNLLKASFLHFMKALISHLQKKMDEKHKGEIFSLEILPSGRSVFV